SSWAIPRITRRATSRAAFARAADMEDPKRILVTRIRQIGDVILTLPLVDALRARFPHAEIDYLAEGAPAQAAIGHPALRRVLTLRKWPGLPAPPLFLPAVRRASSCPPVRTLD